VGGDDRLAGARFSRISGRWIIGSKGEVVGGIRQCAIKRHAEYFAADEVTHRSLADALFA